MDFKITVGPHTYSELKFIELRPFLLTSQRAGFGNCDVKDSVPVSYIIMNSYTVKEISRSPCEINN